MFRIICYTAIENKHNNIYQYPGPTSGQLNWNLWGLVQVMVFKKLTM